MIVPEITSEAAPVHPGPGFPTASLRYFVWLYSPPEQQVVVQALLGLEREIAGTSRTVNEHQVVHVRLEWWRQECERFLAGNPIHPLMRTLAGTLRDKPRTLSGFVDVATWDLAGATFETRRELEAYCGRWASAMFETLAMSATPAASGTAKAPTAAPAGAGASASASAAKRLGTAVREIEFLTTLAQDAHAGRLRVPLDELERAGVDPHSLAKPPWPPPLCALVRDRLTQLRSELDSALDELRRATPPDARARGLFVWAGLARRLARHVTQALPNPVAPGRADTLAETWHAWRAARAAGS